MNVSDPAHRWRQVSLWCDDWRAAEQMAVTSLGPLLTAAEDAGILTSWWFIRKTESWRVRYLPAPGQHEPAVAVVEKAMRDLTAQDTVRRWAATIYEPEIEAFGGSDGIDVAHGLFHADSRHVLDHLRHAGTDHRRELGLVLGTALMRGAGLDWYEQGDVWAQVTEHRTTDRPSPSQSAARSVHQLITARADSAYSPLAAAPGWSAAFYGAGERLADLAHQGRLTRGLRAVLAHHILFAWNRMGIPADVQGVLAGTGAHVVFHRELDASSALISARPRPPRLASTR